MKLHFRDLGPSNGNGNLPIVILHGLFGSGDNWLTFAGTLSKEYRVVLPDLPNHGDSPHTDRFSYSYMAELIGGFLSDNDLSPCILTGHSMGGKIAMAVALEHGSRIERVCLVDIAPTADPARHSEMLTAMTEVANARVRSRREVDSILEKRIPSLRERQFLQKSLTEGEDGVYRWKLNLSLIQSSYAEMLAWPFRGPSQGGAYHYDGPAFFIAGSRSGYVKPEHLELMQALFPHAQLVTVPDAGHWVHAEQPTTFGTAFGQFLAARA